MEITFFFLTRPFINFLIKECKWVEEFLQIIKLQTFECFKKYTSCTSVDIRSNCNNSVTLTLQDY